MLNVLIPSGGKSLFFKDSYFPKQMIEVEGKTMLERVVDNYRELNNCQFIFIFDHKDCVEFHLDESAKILTEPNTKILVLDNETAGALCTCLMAVPQIGNEDPLFIVNCDQIIDVNYNDVLNYFQKEKAAAGVITFESIHPRWSYARVKENEVIEVAEKRPLSKHAIAGFYYYEHGFDFIEAAKRVVLKDNNYKGKYYISASLNELILMGKKVAYYEVDRDSYHSFYSPEKIEEYERKRKESIK